MPITDEERRAVARWAADAAERVLPLFETRVPGDARPREAIAATRTFAGGAGRSRALTRIALEAHRAAFSTSDPVARAAARSASLAAATANIHGEETIGTLGHILGPAAWAAFARELDAAESGTEPTGAAGASAAAAALAQAVAETTPAIRALVGRIAPAEPGRTRVAPLELRLDRALREAGG